MRQSRGMGIGGKAGENDSQLPLSAAMLIHQLLPLQVLAYT